MDFTQEQTDIINSTGDIKINAVAGSGKTTTIIAYAKSKSPNSKILYLAFNKTVKLEATRKFEALGMRNVQVETAHSLAYKHVVKYSNFKVKEFGYKTTDLVEILKLSNFGEKHLEYILANHISKFAAYFCNSNKQKISELDYLETISDPKAKSVVSKFYDKIVQQTRYFLAMMNRGEIEITHDFYLKKFQLECPNLKFDFILFDEGQDASPAMLDILHKQKATKVIVGDTNQQIYGWRYAVNSLEQTDFKSYNLSTSFRFGTDIAKLAMETLKLKVNLNLPIGVEIIGKGNSSESKSKAVIARTNLGLLLNAIEFVDEPGASKKLYFEGNINSYTYADDGASLYDVLNLYNDKRFLIRDQLIKSMKTMSDLEEYIESTEDAQLAMMVEIVKRYGNEIPSLIKKIKDAHLDNQNRENANTIFSTVHRCKGMEYDVVYLANDFITEKKIERYIKDEKKLEANLAKLNEEINLLYVAITRAKNTLHIPEQFLPKDFQKSANVVVIKEFTELGPASNGIKYSDNAAYDYKFARDFTKHFWTSALDEELTTLYCDDASLKTMANKLGKSEASIISRIKMLDLERIYG